jgi:hypothetical protein
MYTAIHGINSTIRTQGVDVMSSDQNWIDTIDRKPEPYSLNALLLKTGREVRGWWTGSSWDGIKVRENDTVIKWRKCLDEHNWLKNKYYH